MTMNSGRVLAVSISREKGVRKNPVGSAELRENYGIVSDAHAGEWHRQVSLLAFESIEKLQGKGLRVSAGDFGENVTTLGIELAALSVGARIAVGESLLEVTQIGKECHTRCAIYREAGDCVMPREGIFARVLIGGTVRPNDVVMVLI